MIFATKFLSNVLEFYFSKSRPTRWENSENSDAQIEDMQLHNYNSFFKQMLFVSKKLNWIVDVEV